MNGNSFIWTCDKKKFLEVLSAEDEYWEKIGNKSNDAWYLKIILKKSYGKFTLKKPECFNFLWDFYLVRDCNFDDLDVTVRWIQKTKIHFERKLHFDYDETSVHIDEFNTKDDYELDIILIFPEDDTLSDYSFSSVDKKELMPVSDVEKSNEFLKKDDDLKSDLLSLFDDEYLADITLMCGSETFKAHKSILSARSSVFKTMFSSETQESNTGTVTITDMDTAVFQAWIHFLYGGQVKIASITFASGLLYVAENYQMKGLKEVCVQYLESVLSTENAIKILEISDLYDEELKKIVISYACDHLSYLKDSQEWNDLKSKNPALALEVYSFRETN